MVRHMLILERGQELHLLGSMPTVWSRAGDVIRLTDIPTSFGPMSLSVRVAEDGKSGWIKISPPGQEMVEKVVVHLEHFERPIWSVRKGGEAILGRTVPIGAGKEILLTLDFE